MRAVPIAARHAIYSALNTLAVQGLAIVAMAPAEYGIFSLYYLAFALASSIVYSVVSESWARHARSGGTVDPWERYCVVLISVAGFSAIPVVTIGMLANAIAVAPIFVVAVFLATYRIGARFYSAALARHRFVGRADLAGALTMFLAFAVLQSVIPPLESVAVAWLASAAVSALLSERPRFNGGGSPAQWIASHKSSIRSLLADSVLLDVGSIGVPLLMAPVLGVAKFGVYRAVSSAALPVRLLLNPVRPLLGRRPLGAFVNFRFVAVILASGLGLGAAMWAALWVIETREYFSEGVIFDLANYAIPIAIFVGTNLVSMFYYLVARTHLPGRQLLAYRIVQLIGAVALPIGGYVVAGLDGAIWGFAANSVVLGALVFALVIRHAHRAP